MTEIDRVKQMVKDGRITEAEGNQLIEVLKGAEAADEELQAADRQMVAESRFDAPLPPAVPTRPIQAAQPAQPKQPAQAAQAAQPVQLAQQKQPEPPKQSAQTPPAGGAAQPAGPAPAGTQWVKLHMLAGDLTVNVDESLEEPEAECDGPVDVIIERTTYGFEVRWDNPNRDHAGSSFVEKMLGKFKAGNLRLTLPKGLGLDLRATAGNVTMTGVPYLLGHMTAGNLDAKDLKGIDFTSRAGDTRVALDLTGGQHRMNVVAGNIKAVLAHGSSAAVTASASIGDITSRIPGTKKKGRGLGEQLSGTLGAGEAKLDIVVTTGNLLLEVDDG